MPFPGDYTSPTIRNAPWNYNSFDPDQEPADLWAMRAVDSAGLVWLPAVDDLQDVRSGTGGQS